MISLTELLHCSHPRREALRFTLYPLPPEYSMASESEMNKPHTKSFKSIEDDTKTDSNWPPATVGSGKGASLPKGIAPDPKMKSTK
jgi:hypothetical protein